MAAGQGGADAAEGRAARAAQDLLPLQDDPAYAGMYVDGPAVVVLLAGEPAPASRALLDACPVPVRLRPAAYSRRRLTAAGSRLATSRESLASAGVELVSWGPDDTANAVRVEVRRMTADAEQLVREVVPEVPLVVVALAAGPDHPPACHRHHPPGPLTLVARACRSCAELTNSAFRRCPACSRRERTCVVCGAPAVHGVP